MHSIRFIHLDIKPSNIAYSPHFKKYVFLDFGLSALISEKFGQKTLSKFIGTPNYCSEQMKRTYRTHSALPIDFYYNDAFALCKTITQLKF